MILTLPRRVEYLTNEATLPSGNPLFRLSPVKSGLVIFNNAGKPVVQIDKNETQVTVALADGGGIALEKSGDGVKFVKPAEKRKKGCRKAKKETLNTEKERTLGELIFFGNAAEAQYEIFVKPKNTVKPETLVRAVAHPIYEKLVSVSIPDGQNVLLAIALCLAVGYFEK